MPDRHAIEACVASDAAAEVDSDPVARNSEVCYLRVGFAMAPLRIPTVRGAL